MGRPQKGENAKKGATFSVDPEVWETFKANVKAFLPDPHYSPHLENLIRAENTRFSGQEGVTNPEVDEAALQRQLRTVTGKYLELKQLLEKQGALDRINNLARDYNLTKSNGEEVIGKLLHGIDRDGTIVHRYIETQGTRTEVMLMINLTQLRDEMGTAEQKLLEVQKKLHKDTESSGGEAAGAAPVDIRNKPTCCLECGNWPAEEAKEQHARRIVGGIKCDAGMVCSTEGKDEACEKALSIGAPKQYPSQAKKELGKCLGRRGCRAKPLQLVYIAEGRPNVRMCDDCADRFRDLKGQFWGDQRRGDKALAQLRSEDADESTREEAPPAPGQTQTTLPPVQTSDTNLEASEIYENSEEETEEPEE